MQRINGAGHVSNRFVHEDASASRPPTELTAAWLNGVQEELASVIEGASIVLSEANNTQLLQAIESMIQSAVGAVQNGPAAASLPPGFVAPFAGSEIPSGWLVANGSAISRTVYAGLFGAIGILYGAGDGSTTFNLPELRSEFIRGLDLGRGLDAGRTLGSTQADSFKLHRHAVPVLDTNFSTVEGTVSDTAQVAGLAIDTGAYTNNGMGFLKGAGASQGGSETRPRNISMIYCIKT